MGDYYRGGFFGSIGHLIGRGIKGVAHLALGTGGGGTKTIIQQAAPVAMRVATGAKSAAMSVGRIVSKHPVLTAAAAAGALSATGTAMMGGRHGTPASLATVPAGGVHFRRHKRINVCNPRALRRAIRRTHGFAKLAMKTIHLIHPKKRVRFGGFKKRRKKA
jgi:hypothetical protein